ncbi:MAG: DUF2892 domain-containing protein [Deltaproteobacteria bacterium]|nr:DUF2892 domain-containing protein [Deltaproteobacteria bacterium]
MTLQNTKAIERYLRVAIAVFMLAYGWSGSSGAFSAPLRVLALYPLITGLVGWCPIRALWRLLRRHP